jgi:hypothetical protein
VNDEGVNQKELKKFRYSWTGIYFRNMQNQNETALVNALFKQKIVEPSPFIRRLFIN